MRPTEDGLTINLNCELNKLSFLFKIQFFNDFILIKYLMAHLTKKKI